MATKKITFDPESGVAYSCDLIMNVGADFNAKFNIVDTANTGFNFSTTNAVGVNTVSPYPLDAVVSILTVNVAAGKAVDPIAVLFVIWDDPVHPLTVFTPTEFVVEKLNPVFAVSTILNFALKSAPTFIIKSHEYATPDSGSNVIFLVAIYQTP